MLLYATDFHLAAMELHSAGRQERPKIERKLVAIVAELADVEKKRANAISFSLNLSDPEDRLSVAKEVNELRGLIEEKRAIKRRLEDSLSNIDDERSDAKTLVEEIALERQKWRTSDNSNEIYESRARVASMFSQFISLVEIDFRTMQATVWIAGFTSAYRFDKDGEIVAYINLLSMFRPVGNRICKFRGMSPPDSEMMPPPNSEN